MADNGENNKSTEGRDKYGLYTEQIVESRLRKLKRFCKQGAALFGGAVFFGVVAGLVILFVVTTGDTRENDSEDESKQAATTADGESQKQSEDETTTTTSPITIETDTTVVTTVADTAPTNETVDYHIGEYESYYGGLKSIVNSVNSSMVTITVSEDNVDWFNMSYQNKSDEVGYIVANDSTSYYIMTDYTLVKGAKYITVKFKNGQAAEAEVVNGDATTGMAIIKTAVPGDTKGITIALLGNSYKVEQGDIMIAVGKLYGYISAMGYGIATSVTNTIQDTDSTYTLINTDICGSETSMGVLVNTSGEIVGVITRKYQTGSSNLIDAYSLSDLKGLLDRLIGGKDTIYLGIKGTVVNDAIRQANKIPEGVYVVAAEINSPAYNAGIKSGDIIKEIDGIKVKSVKDLQVALNNYDKGSTVDIKVQRLSRTEYKEIVFNVVLGVE